MKLRQKLAAVLATAMVVTAVPVTTFAASENGFNREITVMDGTQVTTDTDLDLRIKVDADSAKGEVFYVEAEDFIFDVDAYEALTGDITVKATKTTLEITVNTSNPNFDLPILGTVDGTEPVIIVDGEGSLISSGNYAITDEVQSKGVAVEFGDATNISIEEGIVAEISFEEIVANEINGVQAVLELSGVANMEFDYKEGATLEFSVSRKDDAGKIEVIENDGREMIVEFSGFSGNAGTVTIKELMVVSTDDVNPGELEIRVVAENDEFETVEAVVAYVNDGGAELTVDEEVEFVAGGDAKEVTVTLAELAPGSFDDRRDVTVTVTGATVVDFDTLPEGMTYEGDEEFTIELDVLEDEERAEIAEFEFTLELVAEPGAEGDIVVTAESRSFDTVEVTVGTVVTDKEIEIEAAFLKVGERGQFGGSITLNEEAEGTFERGEYLIVALEEDAVEDNIDLVDFDFEVEGEDLEVEEVTVYVTTDGVLTLDDETDGEENEVADNAVAIQVTDSSEEAGSITLKNFKFNTSGSTPDGTYNVELLGTLISHVDEDASIEEEFVVVGEGTALRGEVVISIGDATYTVDGEEFEATAAAFIDPATNRTMVPVRAIAEAFGCNVDFFHSEGGNGPLVVTLTKGTRMVQFTNGSDKMVVNGGAITMSATMQIVDDTTFVPVAFLAEALEIPYVWVAETQQVIFGN